MAGLKRKLTVLSIEEKVRILKFLDENTLMKKGEIAAKFGIPANTLSTIIKNRETIERNYENNKKKMKKIRKSTYPEVEECMQKWFVQCRDQGIPISGSILQQKAEDFAKEFGYSSDFKASNGWLENFKKRQNIVFRKLYGESASVNESVCNEWLKELPSLLQGYDPNDVFNAGETGLFYRCLPDKTATFKGKNCRGGKQNKLRVTVLLAANQSGTEKLPPVMIGRTKKPRCFAKVKSFPMVYKANQKAWMTTEIFVEWLKEIDKSIALKKRKILLFIDNCNAHSNLPNLKNITVKFLPSNMTSKLQPLDQGIIRSFKIGYRQQLLKKIIDAIDEDKILPTINVLDAMRMADFAWRNVTKKTIKNCFIKAGFKERSNNAEENQTTDLNIIEVQDGDSITSIQWAVIKNKLNLGISFEDFLDIDTSLETCGTLTDADILADVKAASDEEESEMEQQEEHQNVTVKEAEKAVNTLRAFLESSENIGSESFASIAALEKIVQSQKDLVWHQTLLTNLFC